MTILLAFVLIANVVNLHMTMEVRRTTASLKDDAYTTYSYGYSYNSFTQVPMSAMIYTQKKADIEDLHGVTSLNYNEATQILYISFDEEEVAPEELKKQVETIVRSSV